MRRSLCLVLPIAWAAACASAAQVGAQAGDGDGGTTADTSDTSDTSDTTNPDDSGDADRPDPCVDLRPDPPEVDVGDCNDNGVPDEEDVASGSSLDCNGDATPDECQAMVDGCTTLHPEGWMEYRAGTLPIVLSAPHGGDLMPEALDTRPGASTGRDMNTQQLVLAVSDALFAASGQRPHVVLMHLHRYKVEANAWSLTDATAGQPEADAAYARYHALVDAAARAVTWQHRRGLYLDLHGMAASRDTLELGYLLNGTGLAVDDARLDHPGYAANSSMRAVEAWHHATGRPLRVSQLLRGPDSIGGVLSTYGYAGTPGPLAPWPVDEDGDPRGYFDGGYSTGAHGSRGGGAVSGLQIEHTWEGVRDTDSNRAAYATALVDAMGTLLDTFFDLDLDATATVSWATSESVLWEAGAPHGVTLKRRGDLSTALTVTLTHGGTGSGGLDYDAWDSATFATGEATTTLTLQPIDDALVEGPETVTLTVAREGGSNVGDIGSHTVFISDDESPAAWLELTDATLTEGEAVALTMRRDHCNDAMTVPIISAGLATSGVEISAADRILAASDEVLLEPGDATAALTLRALADSRVEGRQRLQVEVVGGSTARAAATLWVLDGDLDPDLVTWLQPGLSDGVAPLADHPSTALVNPRALPSDADGPGLADDAWWFDGIDDGLLMPGPALSADPNPFTVSFRFQGDADNAGAYGYLLSHGRYTWSRALNIYLSSSGTLRTVPTGADEGYDVDLLDVPGDFWDGAWHHYALTVAEADGVSTARVYVDGALAASGSRGSGGVFAPGLGVFIGSRHDTWATTHFQGGITDVRVYQRALDASEVAALTE